MSSGQKDFLKIMLRMGTEFINMEEIFYVMKIMVYSQFKSPQTFLKVGVSKLLTQKEIGSIA